MSNKSLNINNYEAWLLDYAEGSLTVEEEKLLFDFMKSNPDLREDFEFAFDEDLLNAILPKEDITIEVDDKIDLHIKASESYNAENYEEAIIEYVEGLMEPSEFSKFEAFLNLNPILQKEVALYKATILKADKSEKVNLKSALTFSSSSSINDSNYEDLLIEKLEGTLSASKEKELNEFIDKNPLVKKEYAFLLKTKLVADSTVQYPHKENLKKAAPVISLFSNRYFQTAVAATILLMIGFFAINESKVGSPNIVAETKEVPLKDSIKTVQKQEATETNEETQEEPEEAPKPAGNKKSLKNSFEPKDIQQIDEKRRGEETIEKLKLRWQLNQTMQPDYQVAFIDLQEEYIEPVSYDLEEPLFAEVENPSNPQKGFKTVPEVLTKEIDKRLFDNNQTTDNTSNNDRFLAAANKLLKGAFNSEIKVASDTVKNTEMVAFTTPFFEIERKK